MVILILPFSYSTMENNPMLLVNYIDKLLVENNGVVRTNGKLPLSDVLANHDIYNMKGEDAIRKVYNFPAERHINFISSFPTLLYYRDFNDLIVYILSHTTFDAAQKRCAIESRANL